MTVFYQNFIALCAKKNKSPSAVAETIGLSRTSPNGWKKGKQPSDVTLQKLAQFFEVAAETLVSDDFEAGQGQSVVAFVSECEEQKEAVDSAFFNNFVRLCNKIEKSPSAAAVEMGFQRSVVTRWSKGTTPRQATLQKIADYFGVTVEELTEEKKEKPTTQQGGELSPLRQEAWALLNSLSDEKLEKALVILRTVKEM